jgi:hypothetical protein
MLAGHMQGAILLKPMPSKLLMNTSLLEVLAG